MLISTLFSLFVGEIVKGIYTQKATEAVLQTWKNYTQGNQDVQAALKKAFGQTAGAIALALAPDAWRPPWLQPKLSREFAEAVQQRYVAPFCGENGALEQKLRQNAKMQCKALGRFFADYPFKTVSVEEIATLLFNLRFITDSDLLRQQMQATKAALQKTLLQAHFDPDFVNFLVFPNNGAGVLYDGVVLYFEAEIAANERLNRILAHFDRQQILANAKQAQQAAAKIHQQIAGMEQQFAALQQSRKFTELSAATQNLEQLEVRRAQADKALALLEKNLAVWTAAEQELAVIRRSFGQISQQLAAHFDELQEWLSGEFDDVKAELKAHVSAEVNDIRKFLRLALAQLGWQETIEFTAQD